MLRTLMIAVVLLAGAAMIHAAAGAARDKEQGPTVTLIESGKKREVPLAGFDEQRYLARGYLKNTDADGNTVYIFIPDSDREKDVTFIIGSGSGKEASFGGRAGQFTGKGGKAGP